MTSSGKDINTSPIRKIMKCVETFSAIINRGRIAYSGESVSIILASVRADNTVISSEFRRCQN